MVSGDVMKIFVNMITRESPPHKHTYYEIIVYTQGCGTVRAGEMTIAAKPGLFLIIPPDLIHASVIEGDCFERIYVNGEMGHIFSLTAPTVVLDNSEKEGQMLAKMLYANRYGNREYVLALFNAFAHFLLENIKQEDEIFLAVKAIAERISDDFYDCNLDLRALLNQSGYSEDYIRAQFKKITGKTPTEFLTGVRIDHACHLIDLFKNALPLSEVAEKCGYSDYVYFSRRFKQVMGISPQKYMLGD